MRSSLSLLVLALATAACGGRVLAGLDAGAGLDADAGAGPDSDTGVRPDADAGVRPDVDAGVRPDVDAGAKPDADAGAGPDASAPVEPFAGACTAVLPSIAIQPWKHPDTSAHTASRSVYHRIRDLVISPGEQVTVRGHITYGTTNKDLVGEDVEIWLRRCPDWIKLGVLTTDADGAVFAPMPTDLPKGEYRLHFHVLGDGTSAEGVLAVWPQNTQAVVTDIDGTLTTSDWQALQEVLGLGKADMFPDANTVMKAWADKGYRILYLTGRPQMINRYTRAWIEAHGFPPGPIQLSDSDQADSDVRVFKADRLRLLAGKGVHWRAAYGNATTDIGAYADAAIPKTDTFIIGDNAGVDGTQALKSYTAHLPVVTGYPAAVQP